MLFASTVTEGTYRVSSVAGIRRTREVSGCPVRRPGWITVRVTVTAYHGMISLGRQYGEPFSALRRLGAR